MEIPFSALAVLTLGIAVVTPSALAYGGDEDRGASSYSDNGEVNTPKGKGGGIVGGVIGGLVLLMLLVCYCKRKKQRQKNLELNTVLRRARRPSSSNVSGCVQKVVFMSIHIPSSTLPLYSLSSDFSRLCPDRARCDHAYHRTHTHTRTHM